MHTAAVRKGHKAKPDTRQGGMATSRAEGGGEGWEDAGEAACPCRACVCMYDCAGGERGHAHAGGEDGVWAREASQKTRGSRVEKEGGPLSTARFSPSSARIVPPMAQFRMPVTPQAAQGPQGAEEEAREQAIMIRCGCAFACVIAGGALLVGLSQSLSPEDAVYWAIGASMTRECHTAIMTPIRV